MAETTSTLSNNLHTYYQKTLLDTAEKVLRYKQFADEKVHPKGNGKDYYLLRYGNVASSTSELTEAVTPTATTIDTNKYTVTIKEYGQYIPVSTLLKLTTIDPVIESISERMGYAAAKSMDEVIRDHLIANATTSTQYVGSGNTADDDIAANEVFVTTDVMKATRVLKAADAPMFDDGSYVWIVHPYISHDLLADTSAGGFIELNKYVAGLADKPFKGEIGKAYGTRVVETTNVASAANSGTVNVYRSFVLAKGAYVITKFNSDAVEMIVKNPNQYNTSDPLNQVSTVGYKMQFGVKYVGGTFSGANSGSPDLAIQLRGAATGG